jgi:hypothetical protein
MGTKQAPNINDFMVMVRVFARICWPVLSESLLKHYIYGPFVPSAIVLLFVRNFAYACSWDGRKKPFPYVIGQVLALSSYMC